MEKLNPLAGDLRDSRVPGQNSKQGVEVFCANRGVDTPTTNLVPHADDQLVDQFIGIVGANVAATITGSSKRDLGHSEPSSGENDQHSLSQNVEFVNEIPDLFYVIQVEDGTFPQYPMGETFHYTTKDWADVFFNTYNRELPAHHPATFYLYAYNGELPSGDGTVGEVTEGISLSIGHYDYNLALRHAGSVALAPLPRWIVEDYWGEEFRGTLDPPAIVTVAKDLLRDAEPPADFVDFNYRKYHRKKRSGTPRPTKREVREAEKTLDDRDAWDELREEARHVVENDEKERDTQQLLHICEEVLLLGISEARARVLIDLYWNERGKPPYTPAELDKEIVRAWRTAVDDGDVSLGSIPRFARWRYREKDTDWLDAENEVEDLLLGDFLSATSRLMMYAPTGVGKTTFGLALAIHVAAGVNFLHWKGSGKPRRVLYVDGEMSKALMRVRFQEAVRRLGKRPSGLVVLNREHTPDLPSLDTAEGQRWLNRYIEDHGPFDLIAFDNIASLLAGSMIGPESWKATLPWVQNITARGIAQIWVHHTGIDKSHAYGDSTREFAMDTVVRLDPIYHAETDVCFKLSFPKARLRAPDNRADFETVQIQLLANAWQTSGGKKPGIERVELLEATLAANGAISDETAIGHAELARLLADEATDVQTWRRRVNAASQTKPYQHLLVTKGGVKFWRFDR